MQSKIKDTILLQNKPGDDWIISGSISGSKKGIQGKEKYYKWKREEMIAGIEKARQ